MKWLIRFVLLIVVPMIGFVCMPVPPWPLSVVVVVLWSVYQLFFYWMGFRARRRGIGVISEDESMSFYQTPLSELWEEFRHLTRKLWWFGIIILSLMWLLIGEMAHLLIFGPH